MSEVDQLANILKMGGGYGLAAIFLLGIWALVKRIDKRDASIEALHTARLTDAKLIVEVAQKCAQALTNASISLDASSRAHIDAASSRSEFAKTLENFEDMLERSLQFSTQAHSDAAASIRSELTAVRTSLDNLRNKV